MPEAASILGTSQVNVRNLIKTGRFTEIGSVKVRRGHARFLSREAISKEVSNAVTTFNGCFNGVWVVGMTGDELVREIRCSASATNITANFERSE